MPANPVPADDGPAAQQPPDMRETRVVLIGGPSHVCKTMLGQSMAARLGWRHVSTDSIARHPGRPWKTEFRGVPEDVAKHYLGLSVDELITDVLRYYRGMWPVIEALVTWHATEPSLDRLILEGSGVWPERVAGMDLDNVASFWLTADNELLRARIQAASRFDEGTARERAMVEKFIGRNDLYNERMLDAVNRLGLVSIDVGSVSSIDELTERCLLLITR